jgi:hypothetical protein
MTSTFLIGRDDETESNRSRLDELQDHAKDARGRALGKAIERSTPRTNCIHHYPDIVHARLKARSAVHRIGHAGAPLVEPDQPRERSQSTQERFEAREPPLQFHVRDESRDEDQVEGTITYPSALLDHLAGCRSSR